MPERAPQLWTQDFYRAVNPRVNSIQFQRVAPDWVLRSGKPLIVDFDLWCVTGGKGRVCIDGRWHPFAAGEMITIKPGQRFVGERADPADPFQMYFLHLWPFGDGGSPYNRPLAERMPTNLALARFPEMERRFADLFEAHTVGGEEGLMEVKALAIRVLEILFAALRREAPSALPRAYARVLRAHEFLACNYARDLSIDEVAEHVDVSASYLSALFGRYYGCSPIQCLIDLRLRAAKLLLARDERVGDVAEQVGFHSLHYFSRMFKKHVGLSPTAFADRCRRK